MATTNLNRRSFGDIALATGNGTPDHNAVIGEIYVDLDTGIFYTNQSGSTTWEENLPFDSSISADVTANNAKVSADGSVTTHSDVTSAGSGDIITVAERNNISGSVTIHSDVTDAGSGLIITAGERTNITASVTVHSDMSDAGSGAVITTAERTKLTGLYEQGPTYFFAGPDTNNTLGFVAVINENPVLVAGTYLIELRYGWNHDNAGNDFEGRLTVGGTILGDPFGNGVTHKQEPKDVAGGGGGSGTSQQHGFAGTYELVVAGGATSVVLDYRTDAAGVNSTIWSCFVDFKRIA